MAFQPLTYRGQYPPLHPRSPSDVASFELLHNSLRSSLPELAREGDKILNEEMLAKLVDGIGRFQNDHLGRKAKSKYWPTLRIPSPILSDRSSYPNGPLSIAILSAFRIKQTSSWRNFNFDNPKLFDDNIAILKKVEGDLIDRGFLRAPVLYFDPTVEEGLGRGEVARLTKIATRFGATVVEDVSKAKVTHIVAYDPEEHDAKEVIEEEERREKNGGEEMEKTYLKTLAVVDMPVEDNGGDGGGTAAASTASGGGSGGGQQTTKKMALVHWWYHPSSYDEWMAAEDVSGEVESEEHPGIPGGPAVVGCKFVRDVEKYNEWGVEADYAVMEYERKIAYLRTTQATKSSSSTTSKKTSKSKRNSTSSKSTSVSETDTLEQQQQQEPAAKKKRLVKDDSTAIIAETTTNATVLSETTIPLAAAAASSPSKKNGNKSKSSKSTSSSSPTATTASTTNNPNTNTATLQQQQNNSRQTSDRRRPENRTGDMNPRRILTGIRGLRNEVIRRTVYDGALRVEEEPYNIVREALGDYNNNNYYHSKGGGGGGGFGTTPTLNARPEWRKLLPPNGFVRPSVDGTLRGGMTVTELTVEEGGSVLPPAAAEETSTNVNTTMGGATTTVASTTGGAVAIATNKTVAVHHCIPILVLPEEVDADGASGGAGEEPMSIRGGGGDEEDDIADVTADVTVDATVGDLQPQQEQEAVAMEVDESNDDVPTNPGGVNEDVDPVPPAATTAEDYDPSNALASSTGGTSGTTEMAASENVVVANNPDEDLPVESNESAMQLDEPLPAPVAPDDSVAPVENSVKEESAKEDATDEPTENDATEVAVSEKPTENDAAEVAASEKPTENDAAEVAVSEKPTENDAAAAEVVVEQPPAKALEGEEIVVSPGEESSKLSSVAPPPAASQPAAGKEVQKVPSPQTKPVEVDDPPPPPSAADEAEPGAAETAPEAITASSPQGPPTISNDDKGNKPPPEAPATEPASVVHPAATTVAATVPMTTTIQVVASSNSTAPTPVAAAQVVPATTPVPSSSSVPKATTTEPPNKQQQQQPTVCKVNSLPSGTQLSTSLYRPSTAATAATASSSTAAEEDAKSTTIPRPQWYHPTQPSPFEKRSLPEWFNSTAPHRSFNTYISTREKIVELGQRNPGQYITATSIRRSVTGDAGSLLRLHQFLMDWGLLNGSHIGETAPGDVVLRGLAGGGATATTRRVPTNKRKYEEVEHSAVWPAEKMQVLELAVVKDVSKKKDAASSTGGNNQESSKMVVDWDAVASNVGGGVTASDCQRAFINPPPSMVDDVQSKLSSSNSLMSQKILEGVRPEVLRATINAALQSTSDVTEARKASFVAVMASAATQHATRTEREIEATLMDIVDQRVQRLENRVALLDDVEALLEAERVSLELERRDMYTTRCRHWFGDGS